jgi:hypothetical protein
MFQPGMRLATETAGGDVITEKIVDLLKELTDLVVCHRLMLGGPLSGGRGLLVSSMPMEQAARQ